MGRHKQLRSELTKQGFRALNRAVVPLVKAGAGSPLPIGVGVVVVETTGRVSGKSRQVPLLATRLGSNLTVSTVRRNSQWMKNIDADPEISVWVAGRKRPATGSVTNGPLNVTSIAINSD